MKPRYVPSQLVVAVAVLAGMCSGYSADYTFTGTAIGGGSSSWSTGTGWNAVPVSASSTRISLFEGIGFTGPGGTAGTYTLNNNIGSDFQLNRLSLKGTGNSSAGTTTVNVTGGSLSFVRSGTSDPLIDLWAMGFGGGPVNYVVNNDLNIVDNTSILSSNASNNIGATFTLGGSLSGKGDLLINTATPNGNAKALSFSGTTDNTRLYGGDIEIANGSVTLNASAAANYQFYTAGDLAVNGGLVSFGAGSNSVVSVLNFGGSGGSISGANTGHTLVVNADDPGLRSFSGTVARDLNLHYLGAGKLTMPAVTSGGLTNGYWRVGGSGTLSTAGIVSGRGPSYIYAQGTFEVTGTSGNVLGTLVSDMSFYGGAMRFAPTGSNMNVSLNAQGEGTRYMFNSHSAIELDKGNNTSLAVTLGGTSATAVFIRGGGPGTLVIKPGSGLANLGTASGESLRIVGSSSNAVPVVTNGIVAPWIVGQDTNGKGDFLTYSGTGGVTDTGFQVATYSATNSFAGATSASVIKVTSAQTISADTSVYGLTNDSTININSGRVLSLELNNSGLILNGGTIGGAGTFQVGINNTHTRTYSIYTGLDGGTISSNLRLFSGGATGTFGDITGNVVLTKFGEGTLILSGTVTNSGGNPQGTNPGQIVINEGAVRFNANMSNLILPASGTHSTIVLNGGVLETSGTFNRALTSTGNATNGVNLSINANSPGGGFSAGGGNLSVNLGGSGGALVWNSTNFIRDYGQLIFGSRTADGVVDFQNAIGLGANSSVYYRQIDVKDNGSSSADMALISGLISDTGTAGLHGLQKVGAGKLALSANNTYTGITAISQGTLQLGYVGTVNSTTYDGTTGSVAGDIHNYGTLAFMRSNAHTFANEVSGTGDIEHNGTGTTSMTAANTYSGGTVVNAGTLLVNNASGSGLGSGNVAVNGGVLGGSGAFSGDLLVSAGGSLSPGNSIESLGAGSIAFDGGTFVFEINTSTINADLLYGGIASTLSLTGASVLSLLDLGSGEALALGTKFTLISYDGAWNNGVFAGYADGSTFSFAGNTWQIDYNDTSAGSNFASDANLNGTSFVTMTTVVPEPSTCVLLGIGLGAVLFGIRRRMSR